MGAEVIGVQVDPDGCHHRATLPRQEVLGGQVIDNLVEGFWFVFLAFFFVVAFAGS
jgi:hypothetical protein